jgi:DNA repair protein RadB
MIEIFMRISTGSDEMDNWLSGGYEDDIITTLYGAAGSGKTNFCVMAAAQQAMQGRKVIFIDTEGGFSIDRLKQLTPQKVIQNILLLRVTNFQEQKEAFNRLLSLLKKDVGLIIVDSMVMFYRLNLSEANEEKARKINSSLVRQMRILNEIARKKNIPIIITDQVYGKYQSREDFEAGKEKEIEMIGGDIMKYWSKCIIELKNLVGKKKATLIKHRSLPEKEFIFKINDKGIKRI